PDRTPKSSRRIIALRQRQRRIKQSIVLPIEQQSYALTTLNGAHRTSCQVHSTRRLMMLSVNTVPISQVRNRTAVKKRHRQSTSAQVKPVQGPNCISTNEQ